MSAQLSGIYRYPVKSCRGESLDTATVEPWGLAGDRRWMVADESGETVTAREYPRLLLITPELTSAGVWLRADEHEPLFVPTPVDSLTTVSVHNGTPFKGAAAPAEASAWLSDYLGTHVQLVFTHDPTQRHPNPRFARPDDSVSFADAYPLSLATEASLAQVNHWISEGPRAHEGPLPMHRFRPNVVVSGTEAFAEDRWRRIRIGSAVFRTPKGCDRCVMTTTDAQTAARGKEPILTLSRFRRWDGKTWFAMNLIPDTPGATIRLGDEVEILESVDTSGGEGPPR